MLLVSNCSSITTYSNYISVIFLVCIVSSIKIPKGFQIAQTSRDPKKPSFVVTLWLVRLTIASARCVYKAASFVSSVTLPWLTDRYGSSSLLQCDLPDHWSEFSSIICDLWLKFLLFVLWLADEYRYRLLLH